MSQKTDEIDALFVEFDEQLEIYQRLIDELSDMNRNLKKSLENSEASPTPEKKKR